MPSSQYVALRIKVEGSYISTTTEDHLIDVVVEDDLHQPAMAVMRFHDPDFTLIDGTTFNLGKSIEILAAKTASSTSSVFKGEVVSLEPEFTRSERALVVRCYDRSHRLYRVSKTRTFTKKTDSAIVSQIAQESGLQAQVTATSEQHDYVIQANQTDMDFIRARAARNGYRVRVDDRKLVFEPAEQTGTDATDQEWGETLLEFHARLSAVAQPNSIEVRSWDAKAKQAIVGTASTPTVPDAIGESKKGAQLAQTAFGSSATMVVSNCSVRTSGEATKMAQSLLNAAANDYLYADGLALGEPTIKAGVLVKLSGLGTKFSGKYFVTSARHTYAPMQGYLTEFVVSGQRPDSLSGMLGGGTSATAAAGQLPGVAVGIVTNVNDPDSLGRVKLKFPWLDDTQESDWAWVAAPGAGSSRGLLFTPEVNDQMLVAFEQGDLNRPFVIGGLWNSQDALPLTAISNGKVQNRGIKLRAGHAIEFVEDEGSNKGAIIIKTANGHSITISDTDKKIEIKSTKHTITMDDNSGAVTVNAQTSLELKSGANSLKFSSSGIELKGAGGHLNIAAAGVELAANANMTVKANANCDVQANALMNLKTSAIMNIQGTLVKIN